MSADNKMGQSLRDLPFEAERDHDAFRLMLLIRRFEEKAGQLYATGRLKVLPKLTIGREACIYGTLLSRGPGDVIVVGRRCHGWLLGCGITAESLMRALAGVQSSPHELAADASIAREIASQLLLSSEDGLTAIEQAVAQARAARPHDKNQAAHASVVFACLEAGALGDARVLAALEAAAEDQLPIVVILDLALANDETAQHLAHLRQLSQRSSLRLAKVKAIDFLHVEVAVTAARQMATTGSAPTVLEMATQSFRGHGQSYDGNEKPLDRAASDPILMVRNRLLSQNLASEEDLDQAEGWVRDCVNRAADGVHQKP